MGPHVQNHWVIQSLTQSFILLRSVKWVPGIPGNLLVKSKLHPCSGPVALRQLNPIHKKETKSFKFYSFLFFIVIVFFFFMKLQKLNIISTFKRHFKLSLLLFFVFLWKIPPERILKYVSSLVNWKNIKSDTVISDSVEVSLWIPGHYLTENGWTICTKVVVTQPNSMSKIYTTFFGSICITIAQCIF